MVERARVEKVVYEAIDELNERLPAGAAIEISDDAPLYGRSGRLESLDFVEFIMEVETKVQTEFDVDFVLTDEDLLSKEKSPFSTVGTLVEHLQTVIETND